jgi:hypothetical protein
MHQRSAHDVTDEQVSPLDLFTRLLRDRQWWLGSAVSGAGFALQAAALGPALVVATAALARGQAATMGADEAAERAAG